MTGQVEGLLLLVAVLSLATCVRLRRDEVRRRNAAKCRIYKYPISHVARVVSLDERRAQK